MLNAEILTIVGFVALLNQNPVTSQALLENIELDILNPLVTSEEKIRSHGYPAESHYVETIDGYILNIFRLPYSPKLQNENEFRPAVLLQHGLFCNSDCWLVSGPDDSLAYNLVDAGYDVWLGNARGNIYSRNSSRQSPNNPRFWQFSWHEIGYFDLPAMIDYILEETDQNAIHYAGHSQGTTSYFVLLSTRPKYNEKIKSGQLLAPCAFVIDPLSPILEKLSPFLGNPNSLGFNYFENREIFPQNTLLIRLLNTICDFDNESEDICSFFLFYNSDNRQNTTALQLLLETNPAGASSNQVIHYVQLYLSTEFRHYDRGAWRNFLTYGTLTPPNYNLNNIIAPTYLYWSENDQYCGALAVDKLISRMPHLTDSYRINDPLWNHGDFLFNLLVKEVINDRVIEIAGQNE